MAVQEAVMSARRDYHKYYAQTKVFAASIMADFSPKKPRFIYMAVTERET